MVKKVAIITHRRADATNAAFVRILEMCRELGAEVVIPEREAEKSSLPGGAGDITVVPELRDEKVDFCIALGGDGTILRAFSSFDGMRTPVLGINFGRIGFLSALGPGDIDGRLRGVLAGDYSLMDLSLLELNHGGGCYQAVNDIVVHKPEGGTSIRIGYGIGGLRMDSFSCDGMVAATPAGSTAYNLSNGGPVTSLDLKAMILSAIAPHTLRFRPLVLGAGERATIENISLGTEASICVDGRMCSRLSPGESLTVAVSEARAHLVRVPGANFYQALRDKFISPPV